MSWRRRVGRELDRRVRAAAGLALAHLPRAYRPVDDGLWLLGGSVGAAYTDNSAALHRYLRAHHPEIDARWVIDRDSNDVDIARAVGPVLFRDAPTTFAAARRAAVHVISHGVHDVPLCGSSTTRNTVKVRLGHGLTAMKKTKPRPLHTNRSANAIFDLVPVASAFERSNKRAWDIDDDALVITGLPRFDELVRLARAPRANRLLYMPTWRDGLDSRRQRNVVEAIVAFLQQDTLHRALVEHGMAIDVYVHRNMAQLLEPLGARLRDAPVRLLPTSHDVQQALATCSALITDYSSTCWDALYVDKPVLFFQFDLQRFLGERGAYFDLENDAPGPRSSTPTQAAQMVAEALRAGLRLTPAARRWQQRAFQWRDDRNCERVHRAIADALRTR